MRDHWKNFGLAMLVTAAIVGCSKKTEEKKEAGLNISGTIEIDPNLAKKTGDGDTLYLIARPAAGGPPVAVLKLTGKNYPYSFTLTEQNLMVPPPAERPEGVGNASPTGGGMMPSESIASPLNLTVRVDKDGDPMTKLPGDLEGAYEKNPVSLNQQNVAIRIDQVRK